ncbi:MAG: hypothetical protein GX862_07020 [Leucobacter sp.]|nr:hypothetical protein [Leucobacter sp.]
MSPKKWAERWARASAQPLELVPVAPHELDDAREHVDVLLERVSPGAEPVDAGTAASAGASDHQHRHAVRLYAETVALVVSADHELAAQDEVDLEDLALVPLLDHPDHAAQWPAPLPWQDPSWAPTDSLTTLELVATGLGGALLAQPLARHLSSKRAHKVLTVTHGGQSLLPGTEIWATWAASRDADDVQHLIGVLRGRTSRSSRAS